MYYYLLYCTYSTLSLKELILLSITYFSIIYFYCTLSLKELILHSITYLSFLLSKFYLLCIYTHFLNKQYYTTQGNKDAGEGTPCCKMCLKVGGGRKYPPSCRNARGRVVFGEQTPPNTKYTPG